jgi:hypothetical protein
MPMPLHKKSLVVDGGLEARVCVMADLAGNPSVEVIRDNYLTHLHILLSTCSLSAFEIVTKSSNGQKDTMQNHS